MDRTKIKIIRCLMPENGKTSVAFRASALTGYRLVSTEKDKQNNDLLFIFEKIETAE